MWEYWRLGSRWSRSARSVPGMLRRIATLPSTRMGKWIVLAVWILIVLAVGQAAGKFEDAQKNESSSFLPGDTESTRVLDVLDEFGSADIAEAVIVFSRDAGLTARDTAAIGAFRADVAKDPPKQTGSPSQPILSQDGKAAIVIAPVDVPEGESDILTDAVDDLRGRGRRAPGPPDRGHRSGRVLGRCDQGLQRHQLHPAVRHGGARCSCCWCSSTAARSSGSCPSWRWRSRR